MRTSLFQHSYIPYILLYISLYIHISLSYMTLHFYIQLHLYSRLHIFLNIIYILHLFFIQRHLPCFHTDTILYTVTFFILYPHILHIVTCLHISSCISLSVHTSSITPYTALFPEAPYIAQHKFQFFVYCQTIDNNRLSFQTQPILTTQDKSHSIFLFWKITLNGP